MSSISVDCKTTQQDGMAHDGTSHGLVNLTTGDVLPLNIGQPVALTSWLRLTLRDEEGNAFLERLVRDDTTEHQPVRVDDLPVFEVAHIRPRQRIETEAAAYVMLKPYQTYLRPDHEDKMRLARWRHLAVRAGLPELLQVLPTPSREASEAATKPVKRRTMQAFFAAVLRASRVASGDKVFGKLDRRMALYGLSAVLACAGIGAGLMTGAVKGTAPDTAAATEPLVDPNFHSDAAASARIRPIAPAMSDRTAEDASPQQAAGASQQMGQAGESPDPMATTSGTADGTADGTPDTAEIRADAPEPSDAKDAAKAAPTNKEDSARLSPTSPKANTSARTLSREAERSLRARFDSLVLEANYDPYGARAKLQALRREVPRGSSLARDIDATLKSLH